MNRTAIVYLVSFAAFMGPFTQTIYTPILPEVTEQFRTSPLLVNLTISIFTFILALMQLVYGPLTDARGRRRVVLAGIAIYIAASAGCYFSGGIGTLLLFRALQAVGIAAGGVVAVAVIGDLFEGRERGASMGTFQTMVSLGPVVGPIVGGFLGGRFDFHSVFLALAAAGALIWLGHFLFLRETKPAAAAGDRFSARDFLTVLRDRMGLAIVLLGFVQYYTFYNFLVFLPGILNDRYALSAEEKGLVFLPMSLSIVLGSFLGGRLQQRLDGRRLVVGTAYLNVAAVLLFLLVSHVSLPLLMAATVLFGLCLGLSLPVQTTLLTGAFAAKRATATGVYNFARYMGMGCGPLLGAVLFGLGGYALLYGFAGAAFLGCSFALVRLMGSYRTVVAAMRRDGKA